MLRDEVLLAWGFFQAFLFLLNEMYLLQAEYHNLTMTYTGHKEMPCIC